MNENVEKQNRSDQFRAVLHNWLVYLKQTFTFAFGITAITGISFVFTGGFSARSYSDRLFTIGIIVTMIGVFVFITIAGTRKNMGIPLIIKTEEDARKVMEKTQELRDKAEKRYDAGSQVWATGIACMVISVLLFFLLSIFKI
jgi:sugar phosphate permease